MIKNALSILTTESTWDDLLLTKKAFKQVKAISTQFKNNATEKINRKLVNKISPSSPVLFYGSQAKEQINTAVLISKTINKPAYSIDLSRLVSKYIGETEKNLNVLFDTAEKKDWILFFDEADALFGKRTDVKDSHDKYANQEVSYLLKRIEDYIGLVILATNVKGNMDEAFTRRFNLVLRFHSR